MNEDKSFEAVINARMSNGTNPCQMNTFENPKLKLKTAICKNCGKQFKTNEKIDLCSNCRKKKNK